MMKESVKMENSSTMLSPTSPICSTRGFMEIDMSSMESSITGGSRFAAGSENDSDSQYCGPDQIHKDMVKKKKDQAPAVGFVPSEKANPPLYPPGPDDNFKQPPYPPGPDEKGGTNPPYPPGPGPAEQSKSRPPPPYPEKHSGSSKNAKPRAPYPDEQSKPPPLPPAVEKKEDNSKEEEKGDTPYVPPAYEDRRNFINKVCGIVAVLLAISFAIMMIPMFSKDMREYIAENWWITFLMCVVWIVYYCTVMCCFHHLLYEKPINYVLALIFSLITGLLMMCVGCSCSLESILLSFFCTWICVIACILFATFCKYDLTSCYFALFIVGIILTIMSIGSLIICLTVGGTTAFIISTIVSVLFLFYYMWHLATTLQSIIGGKNRKVVFSEDAYMVAAIIVYVDIVEIFLTLLGLSR